MREKVWEEGEEAECNNQQMCKYSHLQNVKSEGLQRTKPSGCFYLIVNVCYRSTPLISACSPQVLELMKEVAEEEDDENISSDISGKAL